MRWRGSRNGWKATCLAAAQEVDKLALLLDRDGGQSAVLDVAKMESLVADSARFDVFRLIDAALNGQSAQVSRMLAGLRGEGEAIPALMGMVVKELNTVAALSRARNLAAEFKAQRVWESKQAVYTRALKRHPPERWQRMLVEAGKVDRISKGRVRLGHESVDAWQQLERLLLAVSDAGAVRLLGDVKYPGAPCASLRRHLRPGARGPSWRSRGPLATDCKPKWRCCPRAIRRTRPRPARMPSQRAEMLDLAIAGEPGLVVDRRELRRAGPSYSVETLGELRAELVSIPPSPGWWARIRCASCTPGIAGRNCSSAPICSVVQRPGADIDMAALRAASPVVADTGRAASPAA